MTRAATEIRFSTLLEKYVNEVRPMIRNTSTSEIEAADLDLFIQLDTHFCKMHVLSHFADDAVSSGLAAEKEFFGGEGAPILNPSFRQKKESAAARLVRTLSKAVSRGGDERNGIHGKAKTFLAPMLKERYGLNSIPIKNYIGSRFNILFANAAYIYGLRKELTELFEISATNQLLLSVRKDIKERGILSAVHVLAKIHKTIIGPLTRFLEKKANGVPEINALFESMILFFDEAAENPSLLMEGSSPFPEEYLSRDRLWEEIFHPNPELDGTTRIFAAASMKSFSSFARKQFKDHIEGTVRCVCVYVRASLSLSLSSLSLSLSLSLCWGSYPRDPDESQ